jgi:hypothetical protein
MRRSCCATRSSCILRFALSSTTRSDPARSQAACRSRRVRNDSPVLHICNHCLTREESLKNETRKRTHLQHAQFGQHDLAQDAQRFCSGSNFHIKTFRFRIKIIVILSPPACYCSRTFGCFDLDLTWEMCLVRFISSASKFPISPFHCSHIHFEPDLQRVWPRP